MKNLFSISFIVLFGTLGLNAQTLLYCTGSKTGAKVSFVSKSGQDITLKVDWDEGSTFNPDNLTIVNGTCTDCQRIGGIGRPHGTSKEWKIRQTDPQKPVSIAWGSSGTIAYCGGNTPVNVPRTAPFDPKWKEMPGSAKAIIAGGTKTFVIGTDNDLLYEWSYKTKAWVNAGRTVKSAAVDYKNQVWTVQGTEIYRFDGTWKKMPGYAKQVLAGGTKVFTIGTDDQMYEWDFTTDNSWKQVGVYPKSAAVDYKNQVWRVQGTEIYRFDGTWKKMPGYAKQVFAGGSKVFTIGTDDQMYEWDFTTDNSWKQGGVYPKSIAVDINNTIWMVEGTKIKAIYSQL